MKIQLLLDANLSWRSAAVLKAHFDECCHVDDTELTIPAKDAEIWGYARNNDMLIVTNDEDFFHLSLLKGFPPKVVLLRTGNHHRKYIEQLLINNKNHIRALAGSLEYGILELL